MSFGLELKLELELTLSLVLVHDQGDDGTLGPVCAIDVLLEVAVGTDGHGHQNFVQIGALVNL